MKKVVLASVLVSAMVVSGTSMTVHAADQNGISTAKVGLTAVDPDNPDNPSTDPIDPDDDPNSNNPTGNTGALRIDYISNIDFGSQTIASSTKAYAAVKPAKLTEAQISDLRGSGQGWNLQVNYDTEKAGFFTADNQELKGAELTLPAGAPKTVTDNQSSAPTASSVVINTGAQNIMTAGEQTGLGTWADQMTTGDVSLKVPSGNLAGSYMATLVWTLTDAPA